MKKTLNVLAALAAVLSAAALSSCYTSYRKPIAHIGSEGEAVVITATNADADGWQDCSLLPDAALYQSGGKVYVAGERRVVTPYCRRWYWSFGDELSLQSGAPNLKTRLQFVEGAGAIPVYGEVELQRREDGTVAWVRTPAPWVEQLPQGARAYQSAHPYCYSSVCFADGTPQVVASYAEQVAAPHSGAHALYAYPLAALAWLACDVPTYVLYHIPHAISYPFSVVQQQVPKHHAVVVIPRT